LGNAVFSVKWLVKERSKSDISGNNLIMRIKSVSEITAYNNRYRDRRQGTPFLCAFHLGLRNGRRKGERRIENKGKAVYVDSYPGYLMLCSIAILLLSIMDAFLTLKILAHGGEELNWFMAVLIDKGIEQFIVFKMALTSLALVILVIHNNYQITRFIRIRHIKYMILSGYSLLIGYELYLLNLAVMH